MDDLRKFALDIAATSLRGAPFTEIVAAAEAFHQFLEGREEVPAPSSEPIQVDIEESIREQVRIDALPPPLPPRIPEGLASSDQSPIRGFVPVPPPQEHTFDIEWISNDPSDAKTRLVRHTDLVGG